MARKDQPDPDMKVVAVALLSPQEAALLAGRLQAEAIRAEVSTGRGAAGPWTAIDGMGIGLPANATQTRTAEVLVDERDLERAREVAARYVER
jgi:hypothetical protein